MSKKEPPVVDGKRQGNSVKDQCIYFRLQLIVFINGLNFKVDVLCDLLST